MYIRAYHLISKGPMARDPIENSGMVASDGLISGYGIMTLFPFFSELHYTKDRTTH